MASGKSGGSVGSHKPVPSWLNSPSWSHTPSSVSLKKANSYGVVDKGIKEREKDNVQQKDEAGRVEGHAAVQEDKPAMQQGNSLPSRNGSLVSSVDQWPSSDLNAHSSSSSESDQPSKERTSSFDIRMELFTIEVVLRLSNERSERFCQALKTRNWNNKFVDCPTDPCGDTGHSSLTNKLIYNLAIFYLLHHLRVPTVTYYRCLSEELIDEEIFAALKFGAFLALEGRTPFAANIQSRLSRKRIHIAELQRMSAQGIPDSGGLRSVTWKLLLGYLPRNQEDWTVELAKKRAEYAAFKEELLVTPSELTRRKEAYENHLASNDEDGRGLLPRHDITHDDHPLSLGSTSVWHQFFQDSELSEQIDRDVKRTHPDIQFFCGESAYALENQEALKRALFIFAKLNPGIRYVQGMNEVLAPLYYVFKTDPDGEYSAHAEADAFFCFVELLSDFRDNFCQQLDNSAVGVRATLGQLNSLLRRSDEELWRHLEFSAKVNPQFYAFRWITLLLTQEFDFLDCLRLWDSFLSNPDGPLEILLRVCCSMLLCVRSRLLAGDFTTNLKLLQNYPTVNIQHLLGVADELRGTGPYSFLDPLSAAAGPQLGRDYRLS